MQEFDNDGPTDLGVQLLDLVEEFEDRSRFIYSFAPKMKCGLKFAQERTDIYRQMYFSERLVQMNDDAWISVYTSDRLGACYLEIRNIVNDKKIQHCRKTICNGQAVDFIVWCIFTSTNKFEGAQCFILKSMAKG